MFSSREGEQAPFLLSVLATLQSHEQLFNRQPVDLNIAPTWHLNSSAKAKKKYNLKKKKFLPSAHACKNDKS